MSGVLLRMTELIRIVRVGFPTRPPPVGGLVALYERAGERGAAQVGDPAAGGAGPVVAEGALGDVRGSARLDVEAASAGGRDVRVHFAGM